MLRPHIELRFEHINPLVYFIKEWVIRSRFCSLQSGVWIRKQLFNGSLDDEVIFSIDLEANLSRKEHVCVDRAECIRK